METTKSPHLRMILGLAGFTIIVFGMQYAANFINPILLALVIAIAVSPILSWLQRRGMPAWLALLITILLLIVFLLALIGYLGISINRFAAAIPAYAADFELSTEQLQDQLARFNIDVSAITDLSFLNPEFLAGVVGGVVAAIGKALGNTAVAILVFVFMLLEATNFPAKLKAGFKVEDPRFARLISFNKDIREYIWITTYTGMFSGLGDTILLIILGVDFPIMWGILAWLLSYIPSLGFWLALIPPTILALLEYGWERALVVVVGYILINGGVENLVKPRVMERGLNLSAVVTVLSVIFWGWILGAIGALLAIPLTMVIQKLVLEPYESTRWLAGVMGSGHPSETVEDQDS